MIGRGMGSTGMWGIPDHTAPRAGSEIPMALPIPQSSERAMVLRNLRRLSIADSRIRVNDEFVAKYLALRATRGPQCRISPQMLLGCEADKSKTTCLKQKFWIVSKTRKPSLDTEIDSKFLVDHQLLQEVPPGMMLDDVWIVDQACPQSVLGAGTVEWETVVAVKFKDTAQLPCQMDCHGSSQHLETAPSPEQNHLPERLSAELDQSETQAARSSLLDDITDITDGWGYV